MLPLALPRPAVRSWLPAMIERLVAAHHARQRIRIERALRLGLGAID